MPMNGTVFTRAPPNGKPLGAQVLDLNIRLKTAFSEPRDIMA